METESQISKLILDEIRKVVDEVLLKSTSSIVSMVRDIFTDAIINSETWTSLRNGRLRAEFGLPEDVEDRLKDILEIWLRAIKIDYKQTVIRHDRLTGGITLTLLDTTWNDVLSSQASVIFTKVGQALPWLEWLLVMGDKVIIKDYKVITKMTPASRSGMAIMTKTYTGRWRVPPEFSGSINNNFVTKIMDDIADKINNIIEREIENRFK